MNKIKMLKWPLTGAVLGGLAGFTYWYFYGCVNGCAITGSAINSVLYFSFMGFLVPGMFSKKKGTVAPNKLN